MYIIFIPLFSDHSTDIYYVVQDYMAISDHINMLCIHIYKYNVSVHSNLLAIYSYYYNIRNNAFLFKPRGLADKEIVRGGKI